MREARRRGFVWAMLAALLLCLAACAGTADMRTSSDETDLDKRANVRVELAGAYFSRGQYSTALDEIKQALTLKPNSEQALTLRGLIYAAMNEPVLAEESFRRAVGQRNSRNGDARHNFGWFLCQQARYAEADEQFGMALATTNYEATARTLLAQGVCQARDAKPEQAEKTLLRAFQLEPGNPAVNINLAEVLYRRGDYERARFYVRRVNASEELVNAQSLWLAVRIERRLNQAVQMRALGRQLASQFPKSPEAQQYEKGQFDEQ